eukprot:TRINITY_DN11865_c0_g1_i1.p1 TRINITY_DN11865_c0_g1~~TRINITY_DN11865_c0_g1_i1.p1  ORF type:complete len:189 (-),score=47.89 TRINITY_DN11865_c0_g1_i1:14-580(-)
MDDNHSYDDITEHEQYQIAPYLIGAVRAIPRLLVKQRFVAYTSEVGEAGRSVMKPWMVKAMYGISFAYVFADTGLKMQHEYEISNNTKRSVFTGAYMLTFHGLASLLLPAVTIHTIVKYAKMGIAKGTAGFFKKPAVKQWGPSIIGLGMIPFIVGPIDHGTEFVMENTLKPLLFGDEEMNLHHNEYKT